MTSAEPDCSTRSKVISPIKKRVGSTTRLKTKKAVPKRERSIQLFVQLVFNQLWVVPPILPQRQAEPFGRRHRSRARSSQRSPLFAAGGTIGEDCHILALVQAR